MTIHWISGSAALPQPECLGIVSALIRAGENNDYRDLPRNDHAATCSGIQHVEMAAMTWPPLAPAKLLLRVYGAESSSLRFRIGTAVVQRPVEPAVAFRA
jgi:hypothetical protein